VGCRVIAVPAFNREPDSHRFDRLMIRSPVRLAVTGAPMHDFQIVYPAEMDDYD
jgi:hypothetical protein